MTVKTNGACPFPGGQLHHKWNYFGGFTAGEQAYVAQWVARWPN